MPGCWPFSITDIFDISILYFYTNKELYKIKLLYIYMKETQCKRLFDIKVIMTMLYIRLFYGKTRLKTWHKMLIVSGKALKSCQNLFPTESHIIVKGRM